MIIDEDTHNSLAHYGIKRKSGRYPWGSGKDSLERSNSFFKIVADLRALGMTDAEIAKSFSSPESIAAGRPDFTTTQLRATNSIARNEKKAAEIATAQRYKDDGWSNMAISRRMGIPEPTVRSLLAPGAKDRSDKLKATADILRSEVDSKGVIDVSKGVSNYLGVADNHLMTAAAVLRSEGYELITVQVPNVGAGRGKKTYTKVLAKPGTTYRDIVSDLNQIKTLGVYSEDAGRTFTHVVPPLSVSSKRLKVRYAEEGGGDADGVIFIRPGKEDLSLGGSHYAQVRIMVDGTHYLKGMAMYKEDLPDGVDLLFNTNKSKGASKLEALKPVKRDAEGNVDEANPFGSIVRQIGERDHAGNMVRVTSAMNLVNEEGDWGNWSKNLSAQMLSKQSNKLVQEQLSKSLKEREEGLAEIMALTNPSVRKKLLEKYAEDVDAAAVHLKAAALPNQKTQVILPMNSLKPTEVYAPNFNHGDRVVLVRYPHGGPFEIPELIVNNRHPEAKRLLGPRPSDAIAIHSDVAKRLSGADFDGDTVLVIPNNHGKVKSKPPLAGLSDFDPQRRYPAYEGMPKVSSIQKERLMGDVSNLITDMTIQGAPDHEIAQAVRHSMVVIDAEKHHLNYRQSAIDNNIASLKAKYQNGRGASTIISQKKSPIRVPERRLRKASEGGPVDPKTGKLVWVETGASYVKDGRVVQKKSVVKKLEYADDAHTLSSGTRVEELYANYSNRLKNMANETRKEALHTKNTAYSESARNAHRKEVDTLNAKLNTALKMAPRERQAQVIANGIINERRKANPGMDKAEVKKLESMALLEARARMQAKREPIYITDEEWKAIQAGAIRPTKLDSILNYADIERVKELATPRQPTVMTKAKQARAQRLLRTGATQAEIAATLGVSLSTLKNYISEQGG